MAVRAIRGATRLEADDLDEMREAVTELVTEMLERNDVDSDEIISALLTSTPDLVCGFPATAMRSMGFSDVPLICASEIAVDGALTRVVRVMLHVESDKPRAGIKHVFMRGAQVLREDLNP